VDLDHLVIAVRDLRAAEENYTRLLGRSPSWRGKHPTYGTANVLYRLDNSYIELLALGDSPGAEARDPRPATHDAGPAAGWSQALRNHLERHGEGLYAIALRTGDIDATVAAARATGLDVQDPAAGDGVDETTGARREWRNARIGPSSTRGVRAFFIQHLSPPDALPPSEPVARGPGVVAAVDHTVIVSSDLAATLALWTEKVGLELRRTVDFSPERRLHFLRLGHSILELAGGAATRDPRPATPAAARGGDLLWGVSYRVDSVAAQVERLRAAAVDVSDARAGRADATVVADLKPGFSHDVRTLFIEK
jgi:catechol 2,3-dioxygenase-like lactoylglutathione lyase family enzyme